MRLLLVALVFSLALPAAAQQPGRPFGPAKASRYVEFDFDVDADALVRQRLADAEKLDQFKKLLKDILTDPKRKIDPKLIEKLKPRNADEEKRLKDWVEKNIKDKPPTLQDVKKFEEFIQKPPPPPEPADNPPPDRKEAGEAKDEPGRNWMKTVMEKAQDSKLGDVLRDSPTWQKTLENLRTSIRESKGDGFDVQKFAGQIQKLKLGDGKWLDRLGDLKPARLPRWDWSPPAPPRGALPNVSTPALPAMSALGTIAIWLICIVLAALVLWQASRWLKGSRRAAQRTFGLGPWPVDPQQVASRAELIKAFDYLAVLVFGAKARPWNHRTVARSLAERAEPLTHLAAELAALYEEARYTDGESALSPDQCELARHALNKLAGVAPA